MCPAKTQISLRIPAVWSESTLEPQTGTLCMATESMFLQTNSENNDQTTHMSEGTFLHVAAQV